MFSYKRVKVCLVLYNKYHKLSFIIINLYFCKNNTNNSNNMDGQKRSDVLVGLEVGIVLKQHQSSGRITEGIVKDILTKSPSHPHGIKVRLTSGDVGRVKVIL